MTNQLQKPPGQSVKAVDDSGNFSPTWYRWLIQIVDFINTSGGLSGAQPKFSGFSGTVVLAKTSLAGSNGSLTVVNGVITNYVAPT